MATGDDDDDDDARTARAIETLLAELEERQRRVREQFLAEQPEHLRARLTARLIDRPKPTSHGEEFAALLVEWASQTPRYDHARLRYLLVWYVKHLHDKLRSTVPDADAVAAYLQAALRDEETDAVDSALTHGWKAHPRGLVVMASRHWRNFREWLTPEQRSRFQPYLAALVPAGSLVAPSVELGPTAPPAPPVAGVVATRLGAAMIALGVPLAAVAAWYAIRGDARATSPDRQLPATSSPATQPGQPAPRLPDAVVVVDAGSPHLPAGPLPDLATAAHTWTRFATGDRRRLFAAAWSAPLGLAVVAGADGAMWVATEPTSWRAVTLPSSYSLLDLRFADGRFVAVGTTAFGSHSGRLIVTSTDGERWQPQRWKERSSLTAVTHGGGVWIAVGSQGAIVRSDDGLTWATVDSGTGLELTGATYHDDRFLVTGASGTLLQSTDGRQWERVAVDTTIALRTPRCRASDCLLTTLEGAVAAGRPGEPWTVHAAPTIPTTQIAAVVDDHYYAAALTGGVLRSRDGVAWVSEIPEAELARPTGLAWTGAWMIAVGADGDILTGRPRP